ncbi:MAG TPA: NAD(P)H-binding protein [Actinomycetota bacterium]|nr:NAD(P)H-binding protein [Actinomycetota bacterium]
MAILVTGAAGLIGRAAVAALLRQDVEHVRAVVRQPAQVSGLRRLGAKVALLDATDPDGLAAAMDGVFTACSLTGSLWSRPGEDPYAAVVEPARVFLAAAGAAGVRRVVVCTPAAVALAEGRSNPHLAAKAEVERMVAASGLEHAVLRCTHVLGPGGRLVDLLTGAGAGSGAAPVTVPGDGRQRVAPVWVGDVAAAIAAADDAVELAATWSLAGPDRLALDDLVDALHGGPVAKRHLDGAAGAGRSGDPPAALTAAQLEVLAADSLPDPGLAAPPGLVPTTVAVAAARIAAAAEQPGGTAGG